MPVHVPVAYESIAAFCQHHHIRSLAFFGSVLRDDFHPESDVDVLVEFEPGHTPGLLYLASMELELADQLGRQVDIRTLEDLSQYFRDDVAASAQTLYGLN